MDLCSDIVNTLKAAPCIVGVGNYFRRDDAVGLYLVDEIGSDARERGLRVVNAEDILESYVFEIARDPCGSVVVMDAVQSGSAPGSVVFGRIEDLGDLVKSVPTHKLPLALAGKIWREAGKEVYLLGIEAEDVDYGTGLSESVKKSADMLKDILLTSLTSIRKEYVYEH